MQTISPRSRSSRTCSGSSRGRGNLSKRRVPADAAVRYLREQPETWATAQGGAGRSMVADALFEHIDVLGLRKATAHLTANIVRHGLAAALPKEVGTLVCGRGERV